MAKDFTASPLRWHSRPLWFWNGKLDAEKTRAMVAACKESGYYGMGILPTADMGVPFMTPEFLNHYQVAAEKAAELGMKLCLYDEFWFPSGSAGGLLARKHPEALGKRLDMLAVAVTGPKTVEQAVPAGTFMGAVAMNQATKQRENITGQVKDGKLVWVAPAGDWQVMLFTCVRDGAAGLVDYLNPDAVKGFIELTYQAYYDKFPAQFGTTIDSAFYDEPAMYHVQGGRAWTDAFNEKFKQKFGFDPVVHYPALWVDIGPDTAAARNALFGMRAELYSSGFPKTINDWCRSHRIQLTGHVDQEELINPVIGQAGDLMKAFKHQDMPGIDQIFQYGRASRAYKVVSSSAYNYDHPLVMTECYGAVKNMPVANLYKEAMDQFAKGINVMVPHAVWYGSPKITFPPDLTPGAATYSPELPAYNNYIGRLQRMLQAGRHVADIGVLYPIATLQAGSWFGPGNPYEGCVEIPEADYMRVGELLALNVRRDFTFIHPEVLDEKCTLAGAEIRLNNKVNAEQYKVFIIPGSRAIHWSSLKKIKQFYDKGGKVIATTRLPDRSAEFGKDKEVQETIAAMFRGVTGKQAAHAVLDADGRNLAQPGGACSVQTNTRGGRAYFIASPQAAALKAVLDDALKVYDVAFEQDITTHNGNLSYIHKVVEGRQVYFVGNSSDNAVDTFIRLRGKLNLACWDPHTGRISTCPAETIRDHGCKVTRVRLQLAPVHSVFLVGPPARD